MPADLKRHSIYSVNTRPGHPPTGYIITLIHMIKGNMGVGLFAMGYAFKHAGLYVAPVATLTIALICIHCQHQLLKCADRVTYTYNKENDPVDYAIAVELCFENGPERIATWSEKMATCINIFICITQLGFCCVYLVFISLNLQQVLEDNGVKVHLRLLIIAVWLPIWIACLITNLKALAPVSMAANLLLFGSFAATLVYAFIDGIPADIDTRRPYTDWVQFSLFFGTMVFAFEGISLVLPLKNVMRNPKLFGNSYGVLNVGMLISVLMYILAGISFYVKWGEGVKGSVTLNLGHTIAAQCVKIAGSLAIMFTYPLQFFVPIQVLLPWFLQKTNLTDREYIGELLFRTLMTIATVLVAEIVPNIGMFISLVGAFCTTALALIFPPIIEYLLLHEALYSRCVKGLIIAKNVIIIIIGLLGFTVGTALSLMEIVTYFQ